METLMTIRHFGERFAVSRATIYREIERGRLRIVKVGTATRIRESDAQAWLEALSSKAA